MKRLAAVALGLIALTACSSGPDVPKQPAATAFIEGTCRTAAPDVLQIGRDARRLGKGPDLAAGTESSLAKAQASLDAVTTAAEPSYQPSLRKLVTAVGLVRFRARVGSYTPSLGRDVTSAYDAVLAVCVKPAP